MDNILQTLLLFIAICFTSCDNSNIQVSDFGDHSMECVNTDSLIFCQVFDSLGNKIEEYYKIDTLLHGTFIAYYENGAKKEEYNYDYGMRHGYAEVYSKSGMLKATGLYYYNDNYFSKIYNYSDEIDKDTVAVSFYPIIKYRDSIPRYGDLEVMLGMPLEDIEFIIDSTMANLRFDKYANGSIQSEVFMNNKYFDDNYALSLNTDIDYSDSILLTGDIRLLSIDNHEYIDTFKHVFYFQEEQ